MVREEKNHEHCCTSLRVARIIKNISVNINKFYDNYNFSKHLSQIFFNVQIEK